MQATVTLQTPPNSTKMSFIQPGVGIDINIPENDPWMWSVDEVVAYICNSSNPVVAAVKTQNRPDLTALERALRKNDVDGAALLVEVNHDTMRSHLGVKSLGHCATIKRMIAALQVNSTGYLEHMQQIATLATSAPPITSVASQSADTAYPSLAGNIHGPLPAAFRTQEWIKSSQTPQNTQRENQAGSEAFTDAHTTHGLISPVVDRKKPASHHYEDSGEGLCLQRPSNADQRVSEHKDSSNKILGRESETYVVDEIGRKRRRLDLTRLFPSLSDKNTNSAETNLITREEACQPPVLENQQKIAQPSSKSSSPEPMITQASNEAGSINRDSNGRKRMVPINVHPLQHSGPIENVITHNKSFIKDINAIRSQKNRRDGQDEYLGVNALVIEGMIYGSIPKGFANASGPSLDTDFVILSSERDRFGESHGIGKRIFANTRMKYFLQSEPIETTSRNGERVWSILPYPDRLGRKHQSLSMTRLTFTKGDVQVHKVDRSALMQLTSGKIYGDDNNAIDLPGFPVVKPGQPPDWDLLEKWKYVDDHDEVQPLYGDSGSENEYSLDLWREVEEEQGGEVERTKSISIRTLLTKQEVDFAIDDAITNYVNQWHMKQKPKLDLKGWGLWRRSRRDGTVNSQIRIADERILHMEARLNKQRQETCSEAWRKSKDVIKSCRNLQPTIDDREVARWTLDVLRLKQSPARPHRPAKKRPEPAKAVVKQEPLTLGEESLVDDVANTESDSDSLGSLAHFIESDDNDSVLDGDDETIDPDQIDDEGDEDHQSINDHQQRIKSTADPVQTSPRSSSEPITPQCWSSQLVDLTELSDSPIKLSSRESAPAVPPTPPLHGESEADDPFQRSASAITKKTNDTSHVIELSSDTDNLTSSPSLSRDLPPLEDVVAIARLDPGMLAERQDRRRLLIHHVQKTPPSIRNQMMTVRQFDVNSMWDIVDKALTGMKGGRHRLRGYTELESNALMRIASLYVGWTIPVAINQSGISGENVRATLIEGEDGFGDFYDSMLSCLKSYATNATETLEKDMKSNLIPSRKPKKRRMISEIDIEVDDLQSTPSKKRKYHVPESQETLEMRATAQRRVQELKERQAMMQYRLGKFSVNKGNAAKVLINVGKEDYQEDIYLNPSIGKIIQPHQQEGVRFIWRELTTDHRDLQGCLLAQTMGLGKTMQVVSVLVTIAEASKSLHRNVHDQVPKRLRQSRTLILCTPALIENWYEEILMWAPPPHSDNVGEIRKVTSTMKPPERYAEIRAWKETGGVLILGYIGFRDMVKDRDEVKALNYDNADIIKILLECPNIVVADEAHSFKNLESALGKAVNDIRCKSRIALTGSPLSNNLNEYYAILDWVAPGYLGNFTEFKANFTEPIEAGLYVDSSHAEYRNSRKRLQALQSDLEPKVHRADASILKARLNGKIEFIVKLSLTPLQEKLYHSFVNSTYGTPGNHKGMETETATLWAWINFLRLLCNHPYTFERRLRAMRSDSASQSEGARQKRNVKPKSAHDNLSAEEETDPIDSPPAESVVSPATIERQLALFKEHPTHLSDISLSHKMQILDRILKLSQLVGDKCLVFSHSLPTLDYIEKTLKKSGLSYCRIDGQTGVAPRQKMCKDFNTGPINVCIISTKAGGQGLNMFGANRVVIMDTNFNPMHEEQAIGRAYRIGQVKPVYVYYLIIGGTFEDGLHHQGIFKQQLATRVVDKKNPNRHVEKGVGQYLHPPKPVPRKDFAPLWGKDPYVLDAILEDNKNNPFIRSIDLTETFHQEDNYHLTPEEKLEAIQLQKHHNLRRTDPEAYNKAISAQPSLKVPVSPGATSPSADPAIQSFKATKAPVPIPGRSNFKQLALAASKTFKLTSHAAHTFPIAEKPTAILEGAISSYSTPFFGVEEPRPITTSSTVLDSTDTAAENPSTNQIPAHPLKRSGFRQPVLNTTGGELQPIADGSTMVGTRNHQTVLTVRHPPSLQPRLPPKQGSTSQSTAQTLAHWSDSNPTQSAFLATFAFLDIPDRSDTDQHWLPYFGTTYLPRLFVDFMTILMSDNSNSKRELDICRFAVSALVLAVCARSLNENHCVSMHRNVINNMAENVAFREIFYNAFRIRRLYEAGRAAHEELMIPVLRLMAGGDARKMHQIQIRLHEYVPPTAAASSSTIQLTSSTCTQADAANMPGPSQQPNDSHSGSGLILGEVGQPAISAEERLSEYRVEMKRVDRDD